MKTTVVEIRIHLPTGQVVTKTELGDVFTFPPINLRTPIPAVFEGQEGPPQLTAIMPPLVAVLFRDDNDPSIWHRWYGAKLEVIERESRIEVLSPRLVT